MNKPLGEADSLDMLSTCLNDIILTVMMVERDDGQEVKERFPATVSVSLLLTHGRSGRLLMTRHGVKDGESESWGLIAGGVDYRENAWDAAMREAWEEARIRPECIIFVRGTNPLEPHVAMVRGEDKIRLGLVFDVTYSGPKVPLGGWNIENDASVDRARFFPWQEVLGLLEDSSKIHRSEFNYPQLLRWTLSNGWRSRKRSEAICQWLLARERAVPGLYRRRDSDGSNIVHWEYTPPYNEWTRATGIHGLPSRTNFARERFYSRFSIGKQ